jgi:uncharacterized protein (DUF433 family)
LASSRSTVQHDGRNDDDRAEKSLGFDQFAAAVRRELAPEGTLESLLVDRVILACWHLRAANQSEAAAVAKAPRRRVKSLSRPALADLQSGAFGAQLSLEKSLDLLQTLRLRDRRDPRWGRPLRDTPQPVADPDNAVPFDHQDNDFSNEWPIVPRDEPSDLIADEPASTGPLTEDEDWQDRLVFDFNVSETSPVVKGTWVTVSQVVSLIVDGWTWGDILRTHPELTEDDIRVCLSYTVAQDNGEV